MGTQLNSIKEDEEREENKRKVYITIDCRAVVTFRVINIEGKKKGVFERPILTETHNTVKKIAIFFSRETGCYRGENSALLHIFPVFESQKTHWFLVL